MSVLAGEADGHNHEELEEQLNLEEVAQEDVVGSLVHTGTTDDASCSASRRCLLHVTDVHAMILADVG